MNYSLNIGIWNNIFAVPASVVDQYIKISDGNSLKLLLYMLRHGGEELSEDTLREALGFAENGEVEDAALFWVQRGIIAQGDSKSALVASVVSDAAAEDEPTAPKPEEKQSTPQKSVRKISQNDTIYISEGDIASRISSDEGVKYLFLEAERMYGHFPKGKDAQTVLALIDHFGLPAEVAAMLLGYCVNFGKKTPSYVWSIAEDWVACGIDTVKLADEKILMLEKQNGIEARLAAAMELKSKFTPQQKSFIKTWTEEWGFGEDMIMLAYDITLNSTGKMAFPYANKILENWNAQGVRSTSDAEQLSASRKQDAKSASSADSSFDMDDVMSQIKSKYNKRGNV